ncbi:hypothetical protein [Saccharopolyspora thermophila]|uniref:hypothetical protein n=1 Tax=Saccharopolyspora thermophila TaxID=89367 RepID=UPI0016653EAD|nr:hypothetical protein [Saccharopolyspora subtropica]
MRRAKGTDPALRIAKRLARNVFHVALDLIIIDELVDSPTGPAGLSQLPATS